MTYYGPKQLADAFRTVRNNTIKIAEEIPEEKYDFQPAPDTRSVRRTLAHIGVSTNLQRQVHGNRVTDMRTVDFGALFQTFSSEEMKPWSKAELIDFLRTEGDAFASFLETFPESALGERVAMMPGAMPPEKSRFEMLLAAKEHEMHHRAQLMTVQRMIGQVPHITRQFAERMARMAEAGAGQGQR